MSSEEDRIHHSRRRKQKKNHIHRQVKLLKLYPWWGSTIEDFQPHRWHKRNAFNCGDPKCAMCGNPRKFFKERTMQEKKVYQEPIDNLIETEYNGNH